MGLKRPPIEKSISSEGESTFNYESFADWFDFPVEPSGSGHILVATGILVRERSQLDAELAALFPEQSDLHLHGVVFQKGHISHKPENLEKELERIVKGQEAERVCHLLERSRIQGGLLGIIELEK